MKRYFVKNKITGDINYCSPFSSREEAIDRLSLTFCVVAKKDRTIDLHKTTGGLVTTVVIVEKEIDSYIAELATGYLLKAYFKKEEDAIDFLYNTYDSIEWNPDDETYRIIHKGVDLGLFEVFA